MESLRSLSRLSEDDLEDFILENSPSIRKKIAKAEEDIKAGKVIPLEDCLAGSKE